MAALPYMPLYVADYLADTAHLSVTEHGAYMLLIMNYWQRGNSLPANDLQLSRIARMNLKDWLKVRPNIEGFFHEIDEQWIHGRIEDELGKVRAKSQQASIAGKASVQQRANVRSTPVKHPLNHTDTDTDTKKEGTLRVPSMVTPKWPLELLSECVDIYNRTASELGLPQCQHLTETRAQKLRARLTDCDGLEGWKALMEKIRGSPLLKGEKGDWKCSFDFLMQASSFTKIMEGNYDGQKSSVRSGSLEHNIGVVSGAIDQELERARTLERGKSSSQ